MWNFICICFVELDCRVGELLVSIGIFICNPIYSWFVCFGGMDVYSVCLHLGWPGNMKLPQVGFFYVNLPSLSK